MTASPDTLVPALDKLLETLLADFEAALATLLEDFEATLAALLADFDSEDEARLASSDTAAWTATRGRNKRNLGGIILRRFVGTNGTLR